MLAISYYAIGIIGYLVNEGLERLGKRVFRWSDTTRVEALS